MSIRDKLIVTSRVTVVLCVIMVCRARADMIPFTYTYQRETYFSSILGCPSEADRGFLWGGSGTATLLGSILTTEQYCLDNATGIYTGNFTLTASSGQVFGTLSKGTFTLDGRITYITDAFRITGGTGPFAGATGSGVGNGFQVVYSIDSPPPIHFTRSGLISTLCQSRQLSPW